MEFFEEQIKIEEIDTITIYKMIEALLKRHFFYEAKCLVNLFIEKRNNEEELEVLNKIKKLIFEQKIEEVFEVLRVLYFKS